MRSRLGRITHPSDFRDILKHGERRSRRGIIMLCKSGGRGARLGFAINRASGNAVHRNRFRRVVREFLRQQSLPSIDLVIMVRTPIAKLDNGQLREAVGLLLAEKGWVS